MVWPLRGCRAALVGPMPLETSAFPEPCTSNANAKGRCPASIRQCTLRRLSQLETRPAALLTLPRSLLLRLLKRHLTLREWHRLGATCAALRALVESLWRDKAALELERDLERLRGRNGLRTHLPEDNLWPQRLYKSDSCLSLSSINSHYKAVFFLLHKSKGVRRLQLLSDENFPERKPVGRSLFRLFCQVQFSSLLELDLSNAVFTLHNLEETAPSFPCLSTLYVQNSLVLISRAQTLDAENDALLRRRLLGYNKLRLRLNQGIKVFLVGVSDSFESIKEVHVGITEFQSTGCIVYSYGKEEKGRTYRFGYNRQNSLLLSLAHFCEI